jgi:hypothetical protein
VPESMLAGKNLHRRQLFSFPKLSITGRKKTRKKLQNKKNQQNKTQTPNHF